MFRSRRLYPQSVHWLAHTAKQEINISILAIVYPMGMHLDQRLIIELMNLGVMVVPCPIKLDNHYDRYYQDTNCISIHRFCFDIPDAVLIIDDPGIDGKDWRICNRFLTSLDTAPDYYHEITKSIPFFVLPNNSNYITKDEWNDLSIPCFDTVNPKTNADIKYEILQYYRSYEDDAKYITQRILQASGSNYFYDIKDAK